MLNKYTTTFPVLLAQYARQFPDCPTSVPWSLVDGHEMAALKNHGQSLLQLARRGGLSPDELYYVVNDLEYPIGSSISIGDSVMWLKSALSPR